MHATRSSVVGRVLMPRKSSTWRRRIVAAVGAVLMFAWAAHLELSAAENLDQGRELFTREWASHEPTPTRGDGLGPYFNAKSCAECHKQGGVGGAGPNENNVQLIHVGLVDFGGFREPDAVRERWFPKNERGVMVLHRQATVEGYDRLRLQRLKWAFASHPEVIHLERPEKAEFHKFCSCWAPPRPSPYEERNTPPLFGAGLIDKVTLTTLEEVAARQSEAVRGRPALLGGGAVGRFGWKGQNATLLDFCENACAVELGLETPRRKQTPAPFPRRSPPNPPGSVPKYGGPMVPDMSADEVAAMTSFVAALPPPMRIAPDDASADDLALGEFVFEGIGCAECHTPNLGEAHGIYSDLLLHQIGTSGSVYYAQPISPGGDLAGEERIVPTLAGEFRTPPLWGVADSGPYLHDGSAHTLEAAIEAHRVQAARSSAQYRALTSEDRRKLFLFLASLRAPQATP